jgi:hypothetical protein
MRNVLFVLGFLALTPICHSYPGSPPMGYAGDPPNFSSCVNCHDSFSLNSGDGSLEIAGLPAAGYESGVTYSLAVTLADPGQSRWGFEITVIHQSGSHYDQAGDLIVTDPTHTDLGVGSGSEPDYLRQTSAGSYNGTPGPTTWSFEWTAPDTTTGTVTFYFAGAACNGGSGSSGDYCYTNTASVDPSPGTVVGPESGEQGPAPIEYRLERAFPNPFNPSTQLRFSIPAANYVTLTVFDALGRRVTALVEKQLEAGQYEAEFDGTQLPAGIYLYRLKAGGFIADGKMVLLK